MRVSSEPDDDAAEITKVAASDRMEVVACATAIASTA
jgi:hypothetical protein